MPTAILPQDLRRFIACGDPVIHLVSDLRLPAGDVFSEGGFADRRVMPQQAITQAGEHKGHAGLRVALRQLQRAAFEIQPLLLILPHAVNFFVAPRLEAHGQLILATGDRTKLAAIQLEGADIFILAFLRRADADRGALAPELFQQQLAALITEGELTALIKRGGNIAVAQAQGLAILCDLRRLRTGRQQRPVGVRYLRLATGAHAQAVFSPGFDNQRLSIEAPDNALLFRP